MTAKYSIKKIQPTDQAAIIVRQNNEDEIIKIKIIKRKDNIVYITPIKALKKEHNKNVTFKLYRSGNAIITWQNVVLSDTQINDNGKKLTLNTLLFQNEYGQITNKRDSERLLVNCDTKLATLSNQHIYQATIKDVSLSGFCVHIKKTPNINQIKLYDVVRMVLPPYFSGKQEIINAKIVRIQTNEDHIILGCQSNDIKHPVNKYIKNNILNVQKIM